MNRFWPILSLCVFFAACDKGRRNIEAYYFPVKDLAAGRVYEYASLEGDTSNREYWYYRAMQTDSGAFLVGTFYDSNFEIGQVLREKIVDNGSLARDLFLYEPDVGAGKQRQIATRIEAPNIFPFEVRDSAGIFLFKLDYQLPGDTSGRVFLIRNRRFAGDAPDFDFAGKKHPCVRFTLREVVGHQGEGTAEAEASGEEIYAKGLGLVQFKKIYGSGEARTVRLFRLKETYPMTVLEQKALGEY